MHRSPKGTLRLFYLIFAASGFAGLIYESIWTHYLKLFLGHAAYAQSLVLAIFMGGMAIGAWLCSRYSGRWPNLLIGYVIVEGLIGICALLFHSAFDGFLDIAYTQVIPALGAPASVQAFKWLTSAAFILPQSILLGMTFPLVTSGLIRRFPDRPGTVVAMLYFTNSIGAAIGVLVSGFALIAWVGLPGTMVVGGIINLLLAATVWYLRGEGVSAEAAAEIKEAAAETSEDPGYALMLAVAFITGMASFIYEIGWIRMLNMVLGSTTHAFELMLSAFITGLAFGGLWIKRRIDHLTHPLRFLAMVQLVMGVFALLTLPLYGNTFEVMQWLVQNLDKDPGGYVLFNISSHAIAIAIMLPTTFCAGMTLPLITYYLLRHRHGEKSVGAVYAFNTVGAIVGVLFAVHIGMPGLGLKGLICVGAAFDIGLALILAWRAYGDRRMPVLASAAGVGALMLTLLFVQLDSLKMASGVFHKGTLFDPRHSEILFHEDGKTATVDVTRFGEHILAIATNGKGDASLDMSQNGSSRLFDEIPMVLAGALPLALHPKAKTAADIGIGSGLTSHILLLDEQLKRVDTIEIEAEVVEGAKQFRPRVDRLFDDPRSHIHVEDAKTFFSTYNRKYDIIASYPSNMWVSGVPGLFTDEFYRLLKRSLNPDGLLVQWMQIYSIDIPLVASVIKALSANFEDYAIYAATDVDILIVAKPKGDIPEPDGRVFEMGELGPILARANIHTRDDILLRRLGDKRMLGPLMLSYDIDANSDYYPVLDLNAGRTNFIGANAIKLSGLGRAPLPLADMLSGKKGGQEGERGDISRDGRFQRSEASYFARMLYQYYLTGERQWAYDTASLPKGLAPAVLRGCAPNLPFDQWLNGLVNNVGKYVLPYLTIAESRKLWQSLEAEACWAKLTPVQREFADMVKAVGERDGRVMAAKAEKILRGLPQMPADIVEYVLAVGMLGNLSLGNQAGARELWHSHVAKLSLEAGQPLFMRLLKAHSDI